MTRRFSVAFAFVAAIAILALFAWNEYRDFRICRAQGYSWVHCT